MLDEAEIRKEIARLEYEKSSYPNYAKLADLYTIRRQMQDGAQESRGRPVYAYSGNAAPASVEPATVGDYGDSDFLHVVAGKKPAEVWPIIDELMSTLQAVNSRAYNSVMRRLSG